MRAGVMLLSLVLVSACGHPWPEEGKGGMAERDDPPGVALESMRDAIVRRARNPGEAGAGAIAEAADLYVRAVREETSDLRRDADRSMAVAAGLLGGADRPSRGRRPLICLTAPCR